MRVVVGRIGRSQGIRGEVTVEVRTDAPEERFSPGALVQCSGRAGLPASLTVAGHRWQNGRLILRLDGVTDRNAAELLRGALLEVDVDITETDDDEFHDLALVGLEVRDQSGVVLGAIREVVHLPGQDLLAVTAAARVGAGEAGDPGSEPQRSVAGSVGEVAVTAGEGSDPVPGAELLVPFVSQIVPVVDLDGGFVVVDLPEGLDELGAS
jgi:16S rRNA processing protein RimM